MKRIGIMLALIIAAARLGELDDNWDFIAQQAVSLDIWNMVHPVAVEAGNRACDPHQGAPCDMDSCDKMAKGKTYCSPVCHKDCCKCPTECNGHQHDPAPNPDDPQVNLEAYYFLGGVQ